MDCVYKITVGEEFYIGSTRDYQERIWSHNSNIRDLSIQTPVYIAIRANDCKYDIEVLYYLKEDEIKKVVEGEYYDKLKPGLNKIRPYRTPAQKKAQKCPNIKARCECGSYINNRHMARHRRSKKHLKFINNK